MMFLKDLAPSVGFGTSGVRALVEDLSPAVVISYVRVFVRHLCESGQLPTGTTHCVVGWDLRPSSPAIAEAVCAGLQLEGLSPDWAGCLPTPALALRALQTRSPGVMVTGSHIPFDRNGIKFYTPAGEILKADETAMATQPVPALLPSDAMTALLSECVNSVGALYGDSPALKDYVSRYTNMLPAKALQGLRVGVYQHSAVGRDLLTRLLSHFGASVVPLGRSEHFIPIDTEAVSAQDEAMAENWCEQHALNAIVSTDGDGDRPWMCDERGRFIRGDIVGILTAMWLGAEAVVTPVSSNTALELLGRFQHTQRTRIGSPYVIEAMQDLHNAGHDRVAGFEANGGFLLQTRLRGLPPLPTRDSVLPILALLMLAKETGNNLSRLPALLPQRHTQADRVQNLPTLQSQQLISQMLQNEDFLNDFIAFSNCRVVSKDQTDGLRITLSDTTIIHLRPSGNAPELRCYTEAASAEEALSLLKNTLQKIQHTLNQHK